MARRKPFKPFNPAEGPWLIWSNHHSLWHRRSTTGDAAGYTADIAHAGIFDEEKAREYHDPPPYRRDEAVPLTRATARLDERLSQLDADRDELARLIDGQKQALARRAKAEVH